MAESSAALLPAQKMFTGPCEFRLGVAQMDQLPPSTTPEIAFAGRSNVGKSSLINALLGRKIAFVSHTPGRTQQLNFFDVGGHFWLVDMPGYGYAKVSKDLKKNWNETLQSYLRGRPNLRLVLLLIDSRHGLKDNDLEMMDMLDQSAVPYRILLTKTDEPKRKELESTKARVEQTLIKHPAAFPVSMEVSSWKKQGLEDIQTLIYGLIHPFAD